MTSNHKQAAITVCVSFLFLQNMATVMDTFYTCAVSEKHNKLMFSFFPVN